MEKKISDTYLKEGYERLRQKGWTQEEIAQTLSIMKQSRERRSWLMSWLNRMVFWGALLLLIFGNMLISVVLIPFMLISPPILLYPGLFIIGVTFGSLYTLVIHDIGKIEDTPKIMPELFIPAIALINVYIITVLSNQLALILNLKPGVHAPIFVAVAYVSGFVVPLLYSKKRAVLA